MERTDVSLSDPQVPVVRGTRFPGNGYYKFPSDTIPRNTDFTGSMSRYTQKSVCVTENGWHLFLNCYKLYMRVCVHMHTYKSVFVGMVLWCVVIALQSLSLLVTFL